MTEKTTITITDSNDRSAKFVALLLLLVLAVYYVIGANTLPHNAGPDEGDSRAAVFFYLEHKRMAVFPEDQDKVKWSNYGATRTMRPPLPYLVSVGFAWLTKVAGNINKQVRYGSVFGIILMLCSGWIAGFIAGARPIALNVAMVFFGLWPQIAFTAMYCNDDAVTWGVCGLVAFVLALLLRYGITQRILFASAAVGGLVTIVKFSAWAWALTLVAALFVAIWRNPDRVKSLKIWLIAIAIFFAFGGWWIISNIVHYGFGDPFQLNAMGEMAITKSSIANSEARGLYDRHGMNMWQALFFTYFWNHTFINTVGNVGWLNVTLGKAVYVFYGWALMLMTVGAVYLIITRHRYAAWALWTFFGTLVSASLYLWFNVYGDVQIQGRYLLPSAPFWLVLMGLLTTLSLSAFNQPDRRWFSIVTIGFMGLLHFYVVNRYVLPHYWQDRFKVRWSSEYRIDFDNTFFIERLEDMRYEKTDKGWKLIKTGDDPRLYFKPDVCYLLGNNLQVVGSILTETADDFVVYVDQGAGFNEENASRMIYTPKHAVVSGFIALNDCRQLRIDPLINSEEVIVRELLLRPFMIRNR